MANTTEKMTNAKAIAFVLENYEIPTEVAEKLQNIKASIEKKNASGSSKPSAKQVENEALRSRIVELLQGAENPMTATEIATAMELSQNRTTALLTALKTENGGPVTRTVVKKVAYFSIEG